MAVVRLPDAPTFDQVMVAPMIANLTDDDGDGTITLRGHSRHRGGGL